MGSGLSGFGAFLTGDAFAEQNASQLPKELTSQWAQDAEAAKLAGLTVSVTRQGNPPAFWGYGCSELPFQTAVTSKTLFPIGSISKHITGVGILRLKESGALRLDDLVQDHLNGTPEVWKNITVRNLLTHTSGIKDSWEFFPDYDRAHARADVITKMREVGLSFRPGDAWAYSSMNYMMLGWIISDVSGRSFSEFMQDQVFSVAGLKGARIDAAEEVIPLRAEGYEWKGGRIVRPRLMTNDSSSSGAGGVLFSGLDSPLWENALSTNQVISQDDKNESFSPAILNSGRGAPYGFGWYLEKMRGQNYYWHGGSEPGYMGQYMRFPALGLSVFVSSNTFGPSGFLKRLPFQVAEYFSPDSTYLSLPDPSSIPDARSRIIETMLSGNLDDTYLAPEAQNLKNYQHGHFGVKIQNPVLKVLPLEEYEIPSVRMIRYRIKLKDSQRHIMVGWSDDNKITWVDA